jgi:hypothetical protein
MKSSYVPERNVLLTGNEYKILQQTALEASYFILHSFSSISKKDPSVIQEDITSYIEAAMADSHEPVDGVKKAREIKMNHTKYIDLFNVDPKNGMDKMKLDGVIPNDAQYFFLLTVDSWSILAHF